MASGFSRDSSSSDSSVSGPLDVDKTFLKVKSPLDQFIAIYDSVIKILAETKNQLQLTVQPLEEHEENFLEEYTQLAEWIKNNRLTEKAQEILTEIEDIVHRIEGKPTEVKEAYKGLKVVVGIMEFKAVSVLEPMQETIIG